MEDALEELAKASGVRCYGDVLRWDFDVSEERWILKLLKEEGVGNRERRGEGECK